MNLIDLIGMKIIAVKGFSNVRSKLIEPLYIMFDDGKTYIQLSEQDYYNHHDCSTSARHIDIYSNEIHYNHIMENTENANCDI